MLRSRLPGDRQVPGALIILGTFAGTSVLATIIGLVLVWAGPARVRPELSVALWLYAGIAASLTWFLFALFKKVWMVREGRLAVRAQK